MIYASLLLNHAYLASTCLPYYPEQTPFTPSALYLLCAVWYLESDNKTARRSAILTDYLHTDLKQDIAFWPELSRPLRKHSLAIGRRLGDMGRTLSSLYATSYTFFTARCCCTAWYTCQSCRCTDETGKCIVDQEYLLPRRWVCNRRCLLSVCLSVCLLATLRINFWTDLHEIFREGWQWASEQVIKFWWLSGWQTRIWIYPDLERDIGKTCLGGGIHCPSCF